MMCSHTLQKMLPITIQGSQLYYLLNIEFSPMKKDHVMFTLS